MVLPVRIEEKISESYVDLSAKLREAADFVVANQMDVAARSLRAVSTASGVSPATLSRLARTLGFDSYEDMREVCRSAVEERGISFADRAERLNQTPSAMTILDRQTTACMDNISEMATTIDQARLQKAVDALWSARSVVLLGALGSTGIVEYVAYLANFFSTGWTLAGRMGAATGAALSTLGAQDALLIVTKAPYARRAALAAEMAQDSGAQTIIITDSHTCPVNKFATFSFIVPSESPQFFSSYAATLALLETMIAMLVAQSGDRASQRIRDVEARNQRLEEYWTS